MLIFPLFTTAQQQTPSHLNFMCLAPMPADVMTQHLQSEGETLSFILGSRADPKSQIHLWLDDREAAWTLVWTNIKVSCMLGAGSVEGGRWQDVRPWH